MSARVQSTSGRDASSPGKPPASRHGRVRRRRRQTRLAGLMRFIVFLFLIFVAVWAGVRVANASGDSAVFEGARYEVRAGDTLWSIAVGHYGDAVDLRKAVYDIEQQNDLAGALVQPGQEILLPFEGNEAGQAR